MVTKIDTGFGVSLEIDYEAETVTVTNTICKDQFTANGVARNVHLDEESF